MYYAELLKNVLKMSTTKVMFISCKALKYITRNDDGFGKFVAGTVCGLATLMLARDTAYLFKQSYAIGRASAKAINQVAEYGEKCFGDHCSNGGSI